MTEAALAIMGRAPVPGNVKTRLSPPLTLEQCADLYDAFLRDTVDLAQSLDVCVPFLALPPGEDQLAPGFQESGIGLVQQSGVDLGERMFSVMHHLQVVRGYSPVVLIGSDIPCLQPRPILAAFQILEDRDLCLGPSQDGGYYLVGAGRADKRIFEGIVWSSAGVLEDTLSIARRIGISVAMLEVAQDVDTFTDLQRLSVEVRRLSRIPGARVPALTLRWLEMHADLLE